MNAALRELVLGLRVLLSLQVLLGRLASRGWRAPSSTTREVVRLTARAVTESGLPDPARPKVFLHIGEPKTGTTFLQQVMWRNRSELAARGVVLPGHHPQDHFRASQDLRGIAKLASDPAGSWTGEWEILARQARQAGKVAVISHELFSAADAEQADRAVRSLLPAEVHIVLTVRDVATLLPAEWQETVKHRNARGWEDWLGDVIDRESADADRRRWWFWRVHDTLAILGIWSRQLPAEHVHVITTPPPGSASGLLWQRFASLLGIDPGGVDLSPRPAERLARDGGDRVPATAEPGPPRRGPRLVLHVERQGSGRPPGPGRPAARGASRPPRQPGCLGQGPGGGTHRRPGRLRVRPHRRSGRAPPAARHRALCRSRRPAGRARARRRRDGGGGAGGQPVPQGIPGGQAAAGLPAGRVRAGPAGSRRPSHPPRGSSGPCASSAAASRRRAPAAHPGVAGRSSAAGRGTPPGEPGHPDPVGRPPEPPERP